MAIISLGQIDKTLIVILVGCIFCFINRYINQFDSELNKNSIINNIVISPSRFLTIIPFIIFKIRTKKTISNNEIENSSSQDTKGIELIYNENNEVYIEGKWGLILLSGIIYLLNTTFFALSLKVQTNSWIWYILIASIFYYLIFKVKLYKHHYLTIILIILIGLVIDLVTENLQNEIINNTLPLIFKFLKEIFFSLYNVLAKYVMERKYISVYEFSFYIGIINFISFFIFAILDYYFFKIYDYDAYFNNFDTKELLIIFGVIFTQLGINLTTLFTTKNNSPCHIFIIFVFGQMAYYIKMVGNDILFIILLIIILFLSLIFNEIIEINIFGLSYNTKRNIVDRAIKEGEPKSEIGEEESVNTNNLIELKNNEIYD